MLNILAQTLYIASRTETTALRGANPRPSHESDMLLEVADPNKSERRMFRKKPRPGNRTR